MIPPRTPANEQVRLETLNSYEVLDTEPEAAFDAVTELAATVCRTPMALITMVDSDRQWFKSKIGVEADETPRDVSFCGHSILGSEIMEIEDAHDDERFHDNPLVTGAPDIRFYAGAPLISPNGQHIGTLCVLDTKPKRLDSEQQRALSLLSRQVVAELELRRAVRTLSDQGALQRSILERAGAAFIVTNIDGVITQFNPAAERLLGYTADEVVGKHTPEIFHIQHELETRAKELESQLKRPVAPNFDAVIESVRRGRHTHRYWTCVTKDKKSIKVLLNATAIRDDKANVNGYLLIGHALPEPANAAVPIDQARPANARSDVENRSRYWYRVATIAAAYLVLAGLARVLAIPTGYSSPFWPAAGLAFAVLLVWGGRFWPGVFVGAFAYDFLQGMILDGPTELAATTLVAAGSSIGATLQAYAGASIAVKFWSATRQYSRDWNTMCFLLAAGPLTCVISPSFGMLVLSLTERLETASLPINWLVWWAGDSIGVALFAPLVILVLPETRRFLRERSWHVAVPLAVAALIVSSATLWLERDEQREVSHHIEDTGEELFHQLISQFPVHLEEVFALERFFASSDNVTRQEFATFVERDMHVSSLSMIAWIPRTPYEQLDKLEKSAHAAGFTNFYVTEIINKVKKIPAEKREEYFPVYFVEPLSEYQHLLGYNLGNEKTHSDVMARTRDSALPIATLSGLDTEKATLEMWLYHAVYRNGSQSKQVSVAQRQKTLQGYILGVIDLHTVFAEPEKAAQRHEVGFRISDVGTNETSAIVFKTDNMPGQPGPNAWSSVFDLYGNTWKLEVDSSNAVINQGFAGRNPFYLPTSVALVIMLASFTLTSAGRNAAVASEVTRRTIELTEQIEARQAIELDLLTARDEAQSASHAKSQFLASMSHEIRTPLNGVIGNLELLSLTKLDNEQSELVDAAESAGTSLLALIGNILDFSKIEAEKFSFELEDVELAKVIEEAAHVLSSRARQKDISIAALMSPEVPKTISSDPARIRQVLINLIGNALKFTDQGGILICVDAGNWDGNVCDLRFNIHDSGVGFDPAIAEYLFDPFLQSGHSERKQEGTGLGLAISKNLIEKMGGYIKCQGEPNEGASFEFTLPVEVIARADAPGSADLDGYEFAIVGDDAEQKTVLREYFVSRGARVHQAEQMSDVRVLIEQNRGHDAAYLGIVCLLDDLTPEVSELLATLRKSIGHGILVTSDPTYSLRRRALRAGFSAVLPGQVSPSFLDLNIRRLVGRSQASKASRLPQSGYRHKASIEPLPSGIRVLVLEDREANQTLIRKQLDKLGVEYSIGSDGIEGLQLTQDEAFDLVLCDCAMPGMDGYEFTRRYRQREQESDQSKHLPIVALTANAFQEDAEQCFDAGMDDFISKPVRLDRLSAAIRNWTTKDAVIAAEPAREKQAGTESLETIDVDLIAELIGTDDPTEIEMLLREFVAAADNSFAEVKEALQNQNMQKLAAAAHGAKGEAKSAGAEPLADLYDTIERRAKENDTAEFPRLRDNLALEIGRVHEFVKHFK